MLEFQSYPLWTNVTVFAVAAAAVWWAGSRLTRYADDISRITGLGQAVIGMLLLGGITSLPEIAVSVTAAASGSSDLGVSNLLGGVALQVVILSVGDAMMRRHTLTSRAAKPDTMLQAVFSCLLLLMVAAAILLGDVAVFGVGLWSTGLLVVGVAMFWTIARNVDRESWTPAPTLRPDRAAQHEDADATNSLARAVTMTVAMGLVVLVAGYFLARTGETLAEQTGLGRSFVGAMLVSFATSLPEITTVIAAVRIRRYTMAFGDIFGTNIFDLMLIFLIDLVFRGPPVLATQGTFAVFAAVLGIAVTLLYVAGLLARRDKAWLRLGADSWLVIATYLAGAYGLYLLR